MTKMRIFLNIIFIFLLFFVNLNCAKINELCDGKLYPVQFENHVPKNNQSAGNYTEITLIPDLAGCVEVCCKDENCNVAMFYNSKCYNIECVKSSACLPIKRNSSVLLQMVLVRTVPSEHLTWDEVFKRDLDERDEPIPPIAQPQQRNPPLSMFDESGKNDSCPDLEECVAIMDATIKGFCKCRGPLVRYGRKCIRNPLIKSAMNEKILRQNIKFNGPDGEEQTAALNDKSVEPEKTQLSISVESKNIQLPDNEASLSAKVSPDEKDIGDKYTYSWVLVQKPEKDTNGTITDQTKETVKLSNLSEGLYRFKLTISGTNSYGEAFSNITVSRANRINTPPVVVITPKSQVIKLPNQKAILDGSASYDDDKIISWQWELVQGPIGYSSKLQQKSTIELDDLKAPGNYTFKLTVIDTDGADNSTTAFLQVVEEIDYPPQANAGADVILYLPHNSITLNGTLSTDDHGIVSWEWTKDKMDDESKAADMQNTRTPNLELSHLEEGIYTFELKVTDGKGQSSASKTHVFVKPPTNLPPVARAGKNITISLPQSWITLNANESTDDVKITQYYWKMLSGPSKSYIINTNQTVANATLLTLGDYYFELIVIDESNNNATDHVKVTVIQEKNAPPVAHVSGGDRNLTLPLSVIVLNGSLSSDDLAIVNYSWTRESDSLAVGNVIGSSDKEAVLMLTDIVSGQYKYKLTVSDEQGLTNSESVTIVVKSDPLIMNLVEVILTSQATSLSQLEIDQLKQKLLLLLGDNVKLNVRDLRIDHKTGHVILIFYGERVKNASRIIMSALEVEKILKEKFWRDYSILGSSINEIRTVVCQNECSGHGRCDPDTRACVCETFWMPDFFYYWNVTDPNCDWSVLYVIVFIFIMFLIISGLCWGLTFTCRNRKNKVVKPVSSRPSRPKRPQKYALLHSNDDELPSFNRNTLSDDSDTDSDVLFENSRQKSSLRNGGAKKTHRLTKLGRRVKT
ncbi:unnamed protein product [Diamesa hyperborea]